MKTPHNSWEGSKRAVLAITLSDRTLKRQSSFIYLDSSNQDGVITDLEPDILEGEVKWDSGSISVNKSSGGDGIPAELFQILKDNAVKVLHSICWQIWKTQQWP